MIICKNFSLTDADGVVHKFTVGGENLPSDEMIEEYQLLKKGLVKEKQTEKKSQKEK